jgi:hypothetical protein
MNQLTLDDALAARDQAMNRVAENAGEGFAEAAAGFILWWLQSHGPTPGEDLTIACIERGIVPHDDRAFGPVYAKLARLGQITKAGFCSHKRGHGTSGGIVWRLTCLTN